MTLSHQSSHQLTPSLLVMAGGTGGHIFPGLAVAEYLRAEGWKVSWLGNPSGMEYRLVTPRGFNFEGIQFGGLRGKGIKTLALLPFNLLRAFWQSLQVLKRVKPDVVLGMGGYVTFPGGMMSVLLGTPLVLHEQNSIAGLANKVLAKVADKNYLQISDKMKHDGTVVSEDLPSMFRGEIITKPMSASTITPVGSCLDSLDGELAPKDGINHCGDFLSCFSCRSFAINGSHDDLHRLFSFYWHLDSELIHTKSASWRDQFTRTMMQIDDFTSKNFSSDIVFKAKNSAKENPNIFWKNLNTRGKFN